MNEPTKTRFKKNETVVAHFYVDGYWYIGKVRLVGFDLQEGTGFQELSEWESGDIEIQHLRYVVAFYGKTPNELEQKYLRKFSSIIFEGSIVQYSTFKGSEMYDVKGEVRSIDEKNQTCVLFNRFEGREDTVEFAEIRITYKKEAK